MYAQKGHDHSRACAQEEERRYHQPLGQARRASVGRRTRQRAQASCSRIPVNHEAREVTSGAIIELEAGWRVTLVPGVYHEFYPLSDECVIGEVSTANDDLHDNFFVNPDVGRYPGIEEDEAPDSASDQREDGTRRSFRSPPFWETRRVLRPSCASESG